MADSIRVEKLNKRYGDDFSLQDVSLRVPQGSVVGFVGANGAGKTTTNQGDSRLDGGRRRHGRRSSASHSGSDLMRRHARA